MCTRRSDIDTNGVDIVADRIDHLKRHLTDLSRSWSLTTAWQ